MKFSNLMRTPRRHLVMLTLWMFMINAFGNFVVTLFMSDYELFIKYHNGHAPDGFMERISNTCNDARTKQTFVYRGFDYKIYTVELDGCVIKYDDNGKEHEDT